MGKLKGFSSYQLHLFAMFFMLIDHIGFCIFPYNFFLRYIGRIAFPIFCFLLVNGFYKTKNKGKYLLRLFLFAIISEIPFDLMCSNSIINFDNQNVLWSFCISFIMLCLLYKCKDKYFVFYPIIIFIFVLISFILKVDYSGYGVLMVLVFYFTYSLNRTYKVIFQVIGLLIINAIIFKGFGVQYGMFIIYSQPFAILSLFFILFYNGELGKKNNIVKYMNYSFYPIHLLFLYFLSLFV